MDEEEARRQGVPLGMTTNDERFYDKYDKFKPNCRPKTNMT